MTPEFDCPQMDDWIGNYNGKLSYYGKKFSETCWSIEYWRNSDGFVTVGAQCWETGCETSKWSTVVWDAFYECL